MEGGRIQEEVSVEINMIVMVHSLIFCNFVN